MRMEKGIDWVCTIEHNSLSLGVNGEYSIEVKFCPFCGFQPERSKREDHESGCGALNSSDKLERDK
jgi:hypothetical protein